MLFKRLIILLFTSLFFWSNHILVQANEGEAFNEKLIGKDNYVYPYLETRNDAGIFYDFSWNTKEKSHFKLQRYVVYFVKTCMIDMNGDILT